MSPRSRSTAGSPAEPVEPDAPRFAFRGRDAMGQFVVFLGVTGAGALPLPLLAWFWDWRIGVAIVGLALIVMVGLRTAIVVRRDEAVITRYWFFLPYRRYRAASLDEVWFDGEMGLPDAASGCVVVRLGEREIHLGSRRTMHTLFARLAPLAARPPTPEQIARRAGRDSV